MESKRTNNNNNTFLAKWLANEISSSELEVFKKSPDYEVYNAIKEGVKKLKIEKYLGDIAYKEFKERLMSSTDKEFVLDNTDNFLGKWLSDDLETKELETFEKSEDYHFYSSIVNGVSKLSTEKYSEDDAYKDFKKKLNSEGKNSGGKVIKLPILKVLSIAASLLLAVGLAFLFTNESHETQFAQLEVVTLPDNSRVTLNSKSKLSYNKILFQINRKLNLEGEAYFEVEKGSNFTVETIEEKVEVLGTKFNVISRDDYFKTSCFEGKVRVSRASDKEILTRGDEIKYVQDTKEKKTSTFKSQSPTWMNGVSEFKNTPLKYILQEIEIQFNVSFDLKNINDTDLLYSGSFPHNNLDSALENVCLPLGIDYTKNKKSNVIVLKMH